MLLIITTCACGEISLSEYPPETRAEKEIIAVIGQYWDAKREQNLDRLMACLHDQGQYNFECRQMVSKPKLKASLPEFWQRLQSGGRLAFPMTHECLNGDYLPSAELTDPKISVNGNIAQARVYYTSMIYKRRCYFSLLKENGTWLINRLAYEPY